MNQEYQKIIKLFGKDFHVTKINVIWGTSGNVSLFSKKLFKHVKNIEYPFGTLSICDDSVTFINVHLEEESVEKRGGQMKEVISKNPNVIGGDFNHQYRRGTSFYKVPGFKITNKTQWTYYIGRHIIIDNILLKGLKGHLVPLDYPSAMNIVGSDHLPVCVLTL